MPVPPEDVARGAARVSAPLESNEEVALPPKYAEPKTDARVEDDCAKVAIPVKLGDAEKTALPVPVSSERSDASIAEFAIDEDASLPENAVTRSDWSESVPVIA